jgi:hypothetical protein
MPASRNTAPRGKTVVLIELQGVGLGVKRDLRHSLFGGPAHDLGQDSAADTARAPRHQDRHPPDVAVGQQTAGTDRRMVYVFGQHMVAICVGPIPFERGWNMLLVDEHRFPNAPQVFVVALPVSAAHPK